MPFSELTRMANVDTTHQNLTYLSTDLSFGGGDNDNFELEWGNSEIMMQDQSCRVAFKDGKDAKHSKMGMFCRIDSVLNDFPLSAPSIEMELDEDDDDSPPWPNFDNEHPFECLHELEFAGNELKTPVGCSSLKQHKLAPTQPSSSSGFRNVPYFSRLASLSDLDLANGSDSEPLRVKDCKNGDENIPEPAVAAASSVCSAKSLERASNDVLACELKRKCHDNEDDESVGVSKTGSKRSRAASVHNNLPERIKWRQRRKDRVNKKMRELQELIPNCNKADKASLLDETIEYLKTLQLQLQILSMGTGMYMAPMMLQATMQQVHRAYVPTFYNMTPMQNFQVPNNQISSPMFHGSIGCSQQHARYPGQEQRMSMPCIPLPIFAAMPNSLMNDKSYLGTDFGKDQYQAVNSAGKGRNPGVAPRNCSSK